MTHLFLCREYPPAPHPPGGIGTYVRRVAHILAGAGETVHVIAQHWSGAPEARRASTDGRLVVHRVPLNMAVPGHVEDRSSRQFREALLRSTCPVLAFAWQAARLAERLFDEVGIDVVEAPEWEAPLAYLCRRSTPQPLLIVHLHSSTEQVYAANHWDRTVIDFSPLAAAEAATVAAADALLCPSRFVADQAVARYGLAPDRVHTVPYPMPASRPLDREAEVWRTGAVCHVGRLEPRKGVLEWTEAWTASPTGTLNLHFAGGDTPLEATGGRTVGQAMRDRLPPTARRLVHFHGTLETAGVQRLLAQSWAAVVPSRWDNLPYSCLEAMASGLPAIVSPHGGMKEIVRDSESGWVAADSTPDALAAVLQRAMAAPASQRRTMGAAAADAVALACDATRVVAQHLTLKRTWLRTSDRRGNRRAVDTVAPINAPEPATRADRLSGMARTVRRDGLPFREWWASVPAADRGQMLATALRHPWRTLASHPLVPAVLRWTRPTE